MKNCRFILFFFSFMKKRKDTSNSILTRWKNIFVVILFLVDQVVFNFDHLALDKVKVIEKSFDRTIFRREYSNIE